LDGDKIEVRPGKITHYTWYKTPDVAVIVPFIDNSELKRLQKQMSQIQKENQKIRSLVSKKTLSSKKITSTKKKSIKKK
jgi:hypothetical protein